MAEKDEQTGAEPEEQEDQQTEGNEESPEDSSAEDDSQQGGESDDEDDEEGEDDSDDEEEDDDDAEPPVRKKDNAFWVGYRKGKKASKQNQSDSDDDEDDDSAGDSDDDEDELDPRDRKILQKELSKALDPITKKLASKEDEDELQGYISSNPHAKPFEKKIRRYMAHPSRQHLPVETVALEVIGAKRLMRLGAQQGKNADKRAGKSKGGGSSTRNAGEGGNVFEESPEEFEARKLRVRQKGNQ